MGVPQGSPISPLLFNIYSETLLESLLNSQTCIPLSYADDIIIAIPNISDIRKVITVLEDWSYDNNMLVNKSKSAILEFSHRGKKSLTINNELFGYPILNNYRYLGCYFEN